MTGGGEREEQRWTGALELGRLKELRGGDRVASVVQEGLRRRRVAVRKNLFGQKLAPQKEG